MRQPFSRTLILVGSFVLVLVVSRTEAGEDDAFSSAWKALTARTTVELERLATICHEARLFAWRNEAYETLLLFAPDHAEARKRLKYKRKDGVWSRGRYKPPRNLKPPSEAQRAARKAVSNRFADAALALMEEHAGALDTARREALMRSVSRCAPERADVRTALGEVRRDDGTWVLRESHTGPARREALRAFAAEALRLAPLPEEARPTRIDNALRLGWSAIYETPYVRLLGTVPKKELLEGVRRFRASYATFGHVFAASTGEVSLKGVPQLSLYVLAGGSDRTAVLENHPAATKEYRSWAKRLQSSWIPKSTQIWIHAPDAPLRLEWVSRQAMGHLLWRRYEVRGAPGWAFEGCGLYLSHLIAGQRRTFFVKRTKYGEKGTRKDDLWTRLRKQETDWRAEARTLLASPSAPDLRLLLGKKLNAMNTEDMLASFALCAFLIEGRPAELPALLQAVGKKKKKSVDALTEAGLDPETLGIKLRRWLEETR